MSNLKSVNLDALSNGELRELLTQHGFPNQPVTNTTRNVLISRLRKAMQEGKQKATRQTTTSSYLARYSSAEEESDRESTRAKGATSLGGQFATTSHAQPIMPPPAAAAKRKRTTPISYSFFAPSSTSSMSYAGTNSNNNNNYNLPTIKVPIQSRNSVYIPPPAVHLSDTDDSDSNTGGSNSRHITNPYKSYGRLSGLSFPKRYSPQLDIPPRTTSHFESPLTPRQRTSFNNNASSTSLLSDSNSSSGTEESPYVSDFTKRLLQFRDRNLAQDPPVGGERIRAVPPNSRYFYRGPRLTGEVVHQAENPGSRSTSPGSISKPMGLFRSYFFRLDQQYGFKQNLVPFVLLGALVLFSAFLVFMYLTISPDLVSTITVQNTKYTRCTDEGYPGTIENCIFENDLEPALDFVRMLVPELQKRVERHMCKDPGLPFVLNAADASNMRLDSAANHDEYDTQRQLLNMEYLIDLNPQWHISNLNSDGAPLSIVEVRQMNPTHANAFGILKPRLPLSCLFLRKLQTFFFVVGTLGLATLISYVGNWLYKYTVRQKQERQHKLNRLISHILQIVMEQASNFPNNAEAAAIVVNHLRDKIVEPAQRTKALESLWREAISFLEHNESRVQFEMGTRNGEDCKLVRWVDTIQTPSPQHRSTVAHQGMPQHPSAMVGQAVPNGNQSKPVANLYNSAQLSKVGETMLTAKKWQSPAFDKTNKISAPPTPCLKIRQMFDKYEASNPNLRTIITDAILEKVGSSCKIYDIFLESQACCVYVRCATAKDAGMVHDEINGWWFDNRLVSIKFLRLERFMDRFPESVNNRHLLRPSNPQKLSLTQCNRYDEEDLDDQEEEDEMNGDLE